MVAPGGRVTVAHHEDVLDKLVYGGIRVRPHIVEENEGVNVELSFHWELTKEKGEGGNGGGTARFQKSSK